MTSSSSIRRVNKAVESLRSLRMQESTVKLAFIFRLTNKNRQAKATRPRLRRVYFDFDLKRLCLLVTQPWGRAEMGMTEENEEEEWLGKITKGRSLFWLHCQNSLAASQR